MCVRVRRRASPLSLLHSSSFSWPLASWGGWRAPIEANIAVLLLLIDASLLRSAFFWGTEPVFLNCKFPSTMEHGQSHGIVVVLPVSAATAVPTVSLSVALKDAVELAPGPAGDPGRRPAHALDDRCQPGNPPTDDSGGPSGKGVPSATAEARPLL